MIKHAVLLGDSGSVASGLTRVETASVRQVEDALNVMIHNIAYAGATAADLHTESAGILPGMFRQAQIVRQLQLIFGLDCVLIALGSNDWGFDIPLREFRNAYAELLDGLRPLVPQAIRHVACFTPPWRFDEERTSKHGESLAQFRAAIEQLAAARDFGLIRGEHAIPREPRFYLGDGVHPNERGHQRLAQHLITHLRPIIQPSLLPAAQPRFRARVWDAIRTHI